MSPPRVASDTPMDLVCACANVRRAARALSRHYEEALAAVDLSSTQMTILMTLGHAGPLALMDLATAIGMDRTSLYRALKPLEKRDLVKVRPSADDRAKEVLLTREGERHLARAMPHWKKAQESFVKAYGASAWDRLREGLTRVVTVSNRQA